MRGGPGGNARAFCYPEPMSTLVQPTTGVDQHGRFRQVWRDPAVEDVLRLLHEGDPSCGWEGDGNLALFLESDGAGGWRWVLERLEADAQWHVVTRARNDRADIRALPRLLVERDRQRGFDLGKYLTEHNDRVQREQEAREVESTAAKLDKVIWSINKDTHGGVHEGPTLRRVQAVSSRLGA